MSKALKALFRSDDDAYRTIYVAHYGHPKLPGARHWALIVMDNSGPQGSAFELTGSAGTYKLKNPAGDRVSPTKANTFLGKAKIGEVADNDYATFVDIVKGTPIVNEAGCKTWHCQHFVMAMVEQMRQREVFKVKDKVNHAWLLQTLQIEEERIVKERA